MATPTSIKKNPNSSSSAEEFSANDRIKRTITPEIVIALCGPIGTPLHRVSEILKNLLTRNHNYEIVKEIRLSEFIRKIKSKHGDFSIEDMINKGNEMRSEYGNSVLAQLAIHEITTRRESEESKKSHSEQMSSEERGKQENVVFPSPTVRYCHIIDSIKNTDELDLLRSVYGRLLHVVSVYSPVDLRVQELGKRLGDKSKVYEIIDRDSGEEFKYGQSVRDVFPKADFFLRVDGGADNQIKDKLERYLDLLLGVRIITPTVDERAMYAAYSAARNSACLSRQVGAAITSKLGDVISVGWNDVPRAFGGLYEASDDTPGEEKVVDHRCWNKDGGKCFNDEEKSGMADRLTQALINEGIVEKDKMSEVNEKLRNSSEVRGLIEFSRAVHAEMHALLNAGHAAGDSVKGGKLYVTTYPCHSCARHIIAAGITTVRFIEPYRKSLATRLHADAITESDSDCSKVRILPFDGVAPVRFLGLFTEGPRGRKDHNTGKMLNQLSTTPLTAVSIEAVPTLESLAIKELKSKGLI